MKKKHKKHVKPCEIGHNVKVGNRRYHLKSKRVKNARASKGGKRGTHLRVYASHCK